MEKAQRHAAFQQNTKPKRRVSRVILVLALIVLAVAAFLAWRILSRPASLFAPTDILALPEQTALAPALPVPDAWMQEEAAASSSRPQVQGNILNILLMGIDAREDGSTTSGTMPHTDVMMVVAVNFDTNSVDLITLPRDLLTTVPGHYGFYKLNGVFNVGLGGQFYTTGQADDLKDGFELTCRAGEMWLGGVSIPYYYALDFQAVMDVVDAIGGIDFDSEIDLYGLNGEIIAYRGQRHLNGDGAERKNKWVWAVPAEDWIKGDYDDDEYSWFYFNKTRSGFEIRGVGLNPSASRYAGMDVKKTIIVAMLISGLLAGVAGALDGIGNYQNISVSNSTPSVGFDGMAVALLASENPIGMMFSALLFSALQIGGLSISVFSTTPSEIVNVVMASIIFFVGIKYAFEMLIIKGVIKKGAKAKEAGNQ